MDGADSLAVILVDLVFQGRNAEVPHLDGAVPEQHNVLGLDVPVDNAPLMGVGKGLCDLLGKMQRFLPGKHAAAVHILLEGDAVDQFHDYVFDVITVAHIVYGDDIRVGKHGNSLGFGAETPAEFLVSRHLIPHDLHSHIAVQPVTHGLIDHGHTALANALQYLISVIEHFADVFFVLVHMRSLFHHGKNSDIIPGSPVQRLAHQRPAKQLRLGIFPGVFQDLVVRDNV